MFYQLPKSKAFVYGLVDPRTEEVRYIGKSTTGLERPRTHLRDSTLRHEKTHKANWIRSLKKEGLEYGVVILEEAEVSKLPSLEISWIEKAASFGWSLTNLTKGGEGVSGYRHSNEFKAKLSASQLGRKLSQETKARIGEALRGRVPSEEFRAMVSRSHLGRKRSEETKRKISEAAKRRWKSTDARITHSALMKTVLAEAHDA